MPPDVAESPQYTEAHISEALATDPRVSLLGIAVSVRERDVYISGEVGTPERKRAVSEVVAELLPGYTIHNDTSAAEFPPGMDTEHLS